MPAFFDSLPHFACLLASDYTVCCANRTFRNLFGEAGGRKCFEAMAGRDSPCEECPLSAVTGHEGPRLRHWHADSGRSYEVHYSPVDESGGFTGMLALGLDITDRLSAESASNLRHDKLEGILNVLADGVQVVDRNGEILYADPPLVREFGPVEDRKCYEYFHGRPNACPNCRRQAVIAGEPARIEWHSAKSGKTFELFYAPVVDARGAGAMLAVFHDITGRERRRKEILESESRLRLLIAQLLGARDEELARISRELHDDVAQGLGVIKLRLGLIQKHLHEGRAGLRAECDETRSYVDRALGSLRRLSRELHPSVLEDLGLATALKRMAADLAEEGGSKVHASVDDLDGLFSMSDQIALFRVVEEALSNIRKHAEAREISIVLERRGGRVEGMIRDDGKGFDQRPAPEGGNGCRKLGLAVMSERVRALGGSLTLHSEVGRGTAIAFSIPIGSGGRRE